ncbi:hypothetical protein ACLMJK_001881 [Lecanora helva]
MPLLKTLLTSLHLHPKPHPPPNTPPKPSPPPSPATLERLPPTAQTPYITMLLSLDTIPRTHNVLAAFSTWILLAGFLIVPGTFTSMEKSKAVKDIEGGNVVVKEAVETVRNVGLMWIAGGLGVVGGVGVGGLWWRWRGNYVWLVQRIFLVLTLNALAGLISTLINVYSQQGGRFSITAKVTVMVTGGCTVVMALLFLIYNNWILEAVKRNHSRELGAA